MKTNNIKHKANNTAFGLYSPFKKNVNVDLLRSLKNKEQHYSDLCTEAFLDSLDANSPLEKDMLNTLSDRYNQHSEKFAKEFSNEVKSQTKRKKFLGIF